ncbi:hypothetical protein GCM10018962_12840 [Dactylosporangium matsuzakiense]
MPCWAALPAPVEGEGDGAVEGVEGAGAAEDGGGAWVAAVLFLGRPRLRLTFCAVEHAGDRQAGGQSHERCLELHRKLPVVDFVSMRPSFA